MRPIRQGGFARRAEGGGGAGLIALGHVGRAKHALSLGSVILTAQRPSRTPQRKPQGALRSFGNLIRALEQRFNPEGEDAEILAGRSDTRFSQIVRNIVSHRDQAGNMINDGLAEYDGKLRGLRITEAGRSRAAAGP